MVERIYLIIEDLIVNYNVNIFLFGSKSQFNDLCYQITSKLMLKYSDIKRIYVRAEFPYIDYEYKAYLLERYEETYYPDRIIKAGKSAYIERNYEMIDKSDFCIVYFDEEYKAPIRKSCNSFLPERQSKSGTAIAYNYALKKHKNIINVYTDGEV